MDFGKEYKNLTKYYGIPQRVFNQISFDSDSSTLSMSIRWINKTKTRIPESLYFRLNTLDCRRWRVEKFGEYVGLDEVLQNGSYHMHNVDGNAFCQSEGGEDFNIRPIDS